MLKKTLLLLAASSVLAAAEPTIATVDFRRCVNESVRGKQEQSDLEGLKKQLTGRMEETEKEIQEIAAKGQDPDYLDSLSPDAEEQLRVRFQTLQQELMQMQQQAYQIINQAEMGSVQELQKLAETASTAVAKAKGLDLILRADTTFYSEPAMDVTDEVIAAMDKTTAKGPAQS